MFISTRRRLWLEPSHPLASEPAAKNQPDSSSNATKKICSEDHGEPEVDSDILLQCQKSASSSDSDSIDSENSDIILVVPHAKSESSECLWNMCQAANPVPLLQKMCVDHISNIAHRII